jgi:N6-adenosine-specific RNA methylase IME4
MNETNSLTIMSQAAVMLAEANTIQKAKELKDLAITAGDWAKRKGAGEDAIRYCRIYALEAERKMGELLLAAEKSGELAGRGDRKCNRTLHLTTTSDLGINRNERSEAQRLAKIPQATFDSIKAGTKTKTQATREVKEQARESQRQQNSAKVKSTPKVETITGLFSTIVIDPPWDWGDEGDVDQLGRAKPDYSTISYPDLLKLKVGEKAAQDAHLYLWITNRSLPKGFSLLDAWGFRYITALTWCKPSFGMGNYFRGQTEHVLFGVKGSLQLKRKNQGTWFQAPRGPHGHSSKPEEFIQLVESCSPGPYLEIFSRQQRKGWSVWGADS